jgi:hypothetical protein
MRYLSKFQREVVDELIKQPSYEPISLDKVLLRFLPSDLHIGKSSYASFCIWYKQESYDYVHRELSLKILEFATIIDELVTYNYLIRVDSSKIGSEEIKIGKKVEASNYGWIRLSTNLTYIDLHSLFLKFTYYPTEKLILLPKHNYKQPEEDTADRNLYYMRVSVYIAAGAAIASMISAFVSVFSIFIQRGC